MSSVDKHYQIFASYQEVVSELRMFYYAECDFNEMIKCALDLIIEKFEFYMAWYAELDDEKKIITPTLWAGKYEKYLDGLVLDFERDEDDAKCAMSISILTKKPFGYADLEHDKDFEKWRAFALQYGYRSNQAVPLVIDGECKSSVLVYSTQPNAFPEKTVEYLKGIIDEVGTIIKNVRIRRKAEKELLAERALRESEEKFRILAEQSPNMIFINQGGKVVYVNDKCVEILGYEKDTFFIPDFTFYSVIAPEYHELIRQNYERHMRGEDIGPYEYILLTKEGGRINAIITTKLISFQGELSILGIITDITELRHLEQDLAELEIQQRIEFGHDLHDGLGQYLTGISLKCKAIENMLSKGSQVRKDDIAEITGLVNQATQKAHDLSEGLAPASLKAGGIETALQELAAQTGSLFEVTCEFSCPHRIPNIDQIVATHLFRIVQEAVTNAIRHGKAKRIKISLEREKSNIKIGIHDDGIGINKPKKEKGGMGLRIMNYRARTIGAVLEIKPAPERGTIVCCTINEKK
jgi:two-component system CheB/CheR fusion protein